MFTYKSKLWTLCFDRRPVCLSVCLSVIVCLCLFYLFLFRSCSQSPLRYLHNRCILNDSSCPREKEEKEKEKERRSVTHILTQTITYYMHEGTQLRQSSSARPNFLQPSSRIALVFQSACSRTIADRLCYD